MSSTSSLGCSRDRPAHDFALPLVTRTALEPAAAMRSPGRFPHRPLG